MDEHKIQNELLLQVTADPNKRVPKYSNFILFSKLEDKGQIILTFLYQEPKALQVSVDEANNTNVPEKNEATLIERIVIDIDHAEKVLKALEDIINKK